MISPRQCALEILHEGLSNGSYTNLLFAQKAACYEDRDRRLITLLVNDTLSHLIHIDYILSPFINGKKVKPIIKNILRMAIDQMKFLEFPIHAVIDESVELCNAIKKPMLKGFVNGVLRNYARNLAVDYPSNSTLQYYSIVNSKPMWLMELWKEDYGFEKAIEYSKIRNAGTTIRFRDGFDGESWLNKNGYSYSKVDIIKNAYTLKSSYNIHNSDEFKSGIINIQGVGSMVACKALNPQKGEMVLDACSAPGGKTVYLCEKMKEGKVVACDLSKDRLKLVKENATRCGFSFVEYRQQDMMIANDCFVGKFDRVLVDAPCSGLGELNSKADIMFNKSAEDVKTLAGIQDRILDCCANYVKKGGVLVYSTCTINKTENNEVVKRFLSVRDDFVLDKFTLDNGKTIESGMVQLTPDVYDGFFAARFIKR